MGVLIPLTCIGTFLAAQSRLCLQYHRRLRGRHPHLHHLLRVYLYIQGSFGRSV
jgi:hypothetical protein